MATSAAPRGVFAGKDALIPHLRTTGVRSASQFVFALVLAVCLASAGAGPSHAQGVVKGNFGDWELRCDQPKDAPAEQCILYQNVADDAQADINIVVVVIRVTDPVTKDAQGQPLKKPVLRVIAPLGVLLPRGLGLKIDDRDIGSTGFVRCLPSGCVAEVELDQALVGDLVKGKVATFIIFQKETEGRGLPLNLTGLQGGLDRLK